MKRRDKGTGSLRRRADGTWEGRVELEPGPNGARRRKSVYGKTKVECQQKIKALLAQQEQGVSIGAPRQTTAQFLTAWLTDVVKRKNKPRTYESYDQIVRCHLVPHIGHLYLDTLTPTHVRQMVNALSDTDLSSRTVRYVLTVLRIALNVAVKDGLIVRNVAQLVDSPRIEHFEGTALTPEQTHTLLLQVDGHRLAPLYHVAVYRGLRRGELIALRWADIDLQAKTLRVADSKTPAGRRTIPLSQHLVDRLHDHWQWQQEERRMMGAQWKEHGLVFPSSVGTPLSGRNLVKHFKSVLNAAGLPDIRFHDLRHTCATLLAARGTPPAVAMRILGQSTIAVTMEVYTHAHLDDMRTALNRIDDALRA